MLLFAFALLTVRSGPIATAKSPWYDGAALVVGSGTYADRSLMPLSVDNDVAAMASALRTKDLAVTALSGMNATRDGVLAALDQLANNGSTVRVVHFSGRGIRLADPARGGGLGTWLMTFDTHMDGRQADPRTMVSEADLAQFARKCREHGAKQIVLSVDACYSGGIDLGAIPGTVVLASSLPAESSYEFVASSGHRYGAFSYALARTLSRMRPPTTFGNLLAAVQAEIPTHQLPSLRGDATDTALGPPDAVFVGKEFIPVSWRNGTLVLPVGEATGAAQKSVYEFFKWDSAKHEYASIPKVAPGVVGVAESIFEAPTGVRPEARIVARLAETTDTLPNGSVEDRVQDSAFGRDVSSRLKAAGVRITGAGQLSSLILDYPRDVAGVVLNARRVNLTRREGSVLLRFDEGDKIDAKTALEISKRIGVCEADALLAPQSDDIHVEVRAVPCRASGDGKGGQDSVDLLAPLDSTSGAIPLEEGQQYVLQVRAWAEKPEVWLQVKQLFPDGQVATFTPSFPSEAEGAEPNPRGAGPSLEADGKWRYLEAHGYGLEGSKQALVFRASQPYGIQAIKVIAATYDLWYSKDWESTDPEQPTYTPRLTNQNTAHCYSITAQSGRIDVRQWHQHWSTATLDFRVGSSLGANTPSIGKIRYVGIAGTTGKLHTAIDLTNVRQALTKFDIYDASTSSMLLDPTGGAARKAVLDAACAARPEDLLLVHCSGRDGSEPDGSSALVTADGDEGFLPIRDLGKAIARSYARRQIVLLDSCNLAGSLGPRSLGSSVVENPGDAAAPNSVLLIAARGMVSDTPEGGGITRAFVKALTDPDTDINGDGIISAQELMAAMRRINPGLRAEEHSAIEASLSGPDFAVARISKPSGVATALGLLRRSGSGNAARAAADTPTAGIAANDLLGSWSSPTDGEGQTYASSQESPHFASLQDQGTQRGGIANLDTSVGKVRKGHDYAILIGVGDYNESLGLGKLVNPTGDVERLSKVLTDSYGFTGVKVLENPKHGDISATIRAFNPGPPGEPGAFTIGKDDQLFFFFAGHGVYVPEDREGYLFFTDSQRWDRRKGIEEMGLVRFTDLLKDLDAVPFGHVMLVLDSCYGGHISDVMGSAATAMLPNPSQTLYATLDPQDSIGPEERSTILRKMGLRSRLVLCSGSGPVPDGARGKGSPFANLLVQKLTENAMTRGFYLYERLLSDVVDLPSGPVHSAFPFEKEDGSFVFVKGGKLQ